MIVKKAVQCVRRGCRALDHAFINTELPVEAPSCARCHGPCVMYMSHPDDVLFTPESRLALDDVVDLALAGSVAHNKLARIEFQHSGYELLGFHGCSYASAYSLIQGGIDLSKIATMKRGRGFYVGNLYDGIPARWAARAAAGGKTAPMILAVYARNFGGWRWGAGPEPDEGSDADCNCDFDWGKMDMEDPPSFGREIAVFKPAIPYLRMLPALPDDRAEISWAGCPADDMKFAERQEIEAKRPQLTQLASTFNMSFERFIRAVLDEKLTKEQKAATEKVLGL